VSQQLNRAIAAKYYTVGSLGGSQSAFKRHSTLTN